MKIRYFLQRMRTLHIPALCGLFSVIVISIVLGNSFFSSLQKNMLRQEMMSSSEYIQSISLLRNSATYFQGSETFEDKRQIEKFFQYITNSPDIFHLNIYDTNYKVIWSSENNLVGKIFNDNEELKTAYTGVSNFNLDKRDLIDKAEHDFLPEGVDQFVESYMPIWDERHDHILGVVETYKSPRAFFELLETIELVIRMVSLLGGTLVYGLLYWMLGKVWEC